MVKKKTQQDRAQRAVAPASQELLKTWGAQIDPELLVLALTHRSFANEAGGLPHNERLEFLGDSVLSIVVTDYLYRTYPDRPEAHLSKMRAGAVSQNALALVARNLNLGSYLLLGRGEQKTGGRDKDSILSDAVEAMIGATYLSIGLPETRLVVLGHLKPLLDDAISRGADTDAKTPLGELVAELEMGEVTYEVEGTGPAHEREYCATVMIQGKAYGQGTGTSKRKAEGQAARVALEKLRTENQISTAPILTGSGLHGETYPHA
ncbi:ribonuclease III [Boudabousia liubingyangii]|uniref:Ribonuclease 3 n=1 Tax=Boudabousia liubingyangii TaxID=1921764 RepID=A0A1Q5PNG6_9ACTO|nr:ribonuclease III [Boudabousia liubingyangii]OKL48995.1 ribonuclease III [Boudabousia liubingyangii]